MRDAFLKKIAALPAHDVTLLATPPGALYRISLTPDYLRKWGCSFSAPAGSPGVLELAEILKRAEGMVPPPGSYDFHIGVLSDGFDLYFDEFGQALFEKNVFQYPRETVTALRKLAKSAAFRPAADAKKECLDAWPEEGR